MDVDELDDGGIDPGSGKKLKGRRGGAGGVQEETVEDLIAKLESKGKKVVLQDPNKSISTSEVNNNAPSSFHEN